MRYLYVRLRPAEIDALLVLSEAERRHPRDQAALLLAEALRNYGAASGEPAPGSITAKGAYGERDACAV